LREQCAKANVRLQVLVELDADLGQIKHRLNARDETSAEISDARLEDFEKLNAAYEAPSGLARDLIKISTKNAASDTARSVLLQFEREAAPQEVTSRRLTMGSFQILAPYARHVYRNVASIREARPIRSDTSCLCCSDRGSIL